MEDFGIPLETRLRDGKVFVVVSLTRTCDDFNWLIGSTVLIARGQYVVIGVEHFLHAPPWLCGESVGLLVVPVP